MASPKFGATLEALAIPIGALAGAMVLFGLFMLVLGRYGWMVTAAVSLGVRSSAMRATVNSLRILPSGSSA